MMGRSTLPEHNVGEQINDKLTPHELYSQRD